MVSHHPLALLELIFSDITDVFLAQFGVNFFHCSFDLCLCQIEQFPIVAGFNGRIACLDLLHAEVSVENIASSRSGNRHGHRWRRSDIRRG